MLYLGHGLMFYHEKIATITKRKIACRGENIAWTEGMCGAPKVNI